MPTPRIFIDGHAGTTGLRIHEWLAGRDDLELVTLQESERKSEPARRKAIAESNLAILCLPDDAAREAASWAAESGARVLDASSSHRVAEGWVYGLPELAPGQRDAIRAANRVTNPGCYPSAFLLLIRPLVDAGLLPADAPIAIHALSGYSGGGKPLIERWESPETRLCDHLFFEAPYALDRIHKHIPEMQRYSGLQHAPQFVPAVGPFPSGMRVEVPLHASLLAPGTRAEAAWEILEERYRAEPFVELAPLAPLPPEAPQPPAPPSAGGPSVATLDEWTLDPTALNGTNRIRLHVYPNPAGHLLLVGVLDNLGKGASGVAIQSLNLMLGLAEEVGLSR